VGLGLGARAGRRSQLRIVYEEFVYKLGKEAGIMSWITCTGISIGRQPIQARR